MTNIFNYIRQNSTAFVFLLAALTVGGFLVACNGLKISDYIHVDVPKEVQARAEIPADITLTSAEDAWEDWADYVKDEQAKLKTATDRFERNIADAEATYALIFNVLDTGLSSPEARAAGDQVRAFPGGALLLGGLGTLFAYFLPQPGTAKRLKDAEDKGYVEGQEAERAALKAARGEL